MIVYHDAQVSRQAAVLAASLAKKSGHIGHARDGLIVLKPGANSQGLSLLGVKPASQIDWTTIKAVISFGEMLPEACTQNAEFLAVQDVYLTDTASRADVVLPGSIFAETDGTYLSAQRKLGVVRKAFRPLCGFEGWQMIQALANDCMESRGMDYESPAEIFCRSLCEGRGLARRKPLCRLWKASGLLACGAEPGAHACCREGCAAAGECAAVRSPGMCQCVGAKVYHKTEFYAAMIDEK